MGQYFKAVNTDKKEFVCPWCIGGLGKLIEWAINSQGAIFTLLLRKSSGGGGGDYYGYRTQHISLDSESPDDNPSVAHASLEGQIKAVAALEGQPIDPPEDAIAGRWAGDRVVLVGDYDASGLYEECESYRNISKELVEVWNEFIDVDEMQLEYRPCDGHQHS